MCLLIADTVAKHWHRAVVHQDPPLLAFTVRAPDLASNALAMHDMVDGSVDAEAWWEQSRRTVLMLRQDAKRGL